MKNHSLLNFFIFTSFLVLGYWISTKFFRAEYGIASSSMSLISTRQPNSVDTLNNGQRNILLIGSSKISNAHPQLESIWLVTYFISEPTIRLLPIFPSGEETSSNFEGQLDRSFDLINEHGTLQLSPEFINTLESNNFRWSSYLVLDKYAARKIIDLLGGIVLNGETTSGDQAIRELPDAIENPQEAFSYQVNVMQATCRKLSDVTSQPDWSQVVSLIPDHAITDLSSDQFLIEWENLLAKENPSCNFPTLEILINEH
jgi:hypothetical protein